MTVVDAHRVRFEFPVCVQGIESLGATEGSPSFSLQFEPVLVDWLVVDEKGAMLLTDPGHRTPPDDGEYETVPWKTWSETLDWAFQRSTWTCVLKGRTR